MNRERPKETSGFSIDEKACDPLNDHESAVEYSEKFLSSTIFDHQFIQNEQAKALIQPTIVFDLDDTLRGWDEISNKGFLRDHLKTLLDNLKQKGFRLIIWSSSLRDSIQQTLNKYPGFEDYFDLIISAENYSYDQLSQKDKAKIKETDGRYYNVLQETIDPKSDKFFPGSRPPKDIGFLGYKLIVEDDPRALMDATRFDFNCLLIPSCNYENRTKGEPVVIPHPDIHRNYFANHIEREISNIMESKNLTDLQDRYHNNSQPT